MKTSIFFIVVTFILTAGFLNAQTDFVDYKDLISQKSVQNYISAIVSDNTGLKSSAIQFAREYKIKEAINPIISVLNDPQENRIVKFEAALALCDIGDPKGILAVKEASINNKDNYVREICSTIFEEFESYNFSVSNK